MKAVLTEQGQLELPDEIRQKDDIAPGQEFVIERLDYGKYQLTLRNPPSNTGLVSWLRSCPEKDFFVPIESESTDTL